MRWLGKKLESHGLMFSNLSFANWTRKKMRLVLSQLPQAGVKSKGEAGKFRLFGVCFLPPVPLRWDAVLWFVATVLHSWNQDLFLSLPLLHACAYVHARTNTHTALSPNLLQKGLFIRLLHRRHSFLGAAMVWWKDKEQCLTTGSTDFTMNFIWPTSSCGMDIYLPNCEKLQNQIFSF